MRPERRYQPALIERIRHLFPGCIILKNDSEYMPGVPDWLILWQDRWATLEVKRTCPRSSADFEPNQEWYIELMDSMSFSACIYPENEDEVLDALQRQFQARRKTRVSQR